MPTIRKIGTTYVVDGHPMSAESFAIRYPGEAADTATAEPEAQAPQPTGLEKARAARAANVAARKAKAVTEAAAPTVIPAAPKPTQLEASAARDLAAEEAAAARLAVVSTVTPEQIAAADAAIAKAKAEFLAELGQGDDGVREGDVTEPEAAVAEAV